MTRVLFIKKASVLLTAQWIIMMNVHLGDSPAHTLSTHVMFTRTSLCSTHLWYLQRADGWLVDARHRGNLRDASNAGVPHLAQAGLRLRGGERGGEEAGGERYTWPQHLFPRAAQNDQPCSTTVSQRGDVLDLFFFKFIAIFTTTCIWKKLQSLFCKLRSGCVF